MKIIKYPKSCKITEKLKTIMLIAAIFSVFFLISSDVQAASFADNQTVDENKAWTIRFSSEVNFDDLTKQGITVVDSEGNKEKVGLQIGQDNKTVIVTAPESGYIAGKSYTLNIGNQVHSINGKTLNKEHKLNFNIKSSEDKFLSGKKIKSGNLSTDYDDAHVLSDIDKFQLNTLNIPVIIKIDTVSSSTMEIDKDSEKRAINLISKLKGKNINIILEPYPWIADGKAVETEWKPDDMDAFFSNWQTKVLKPLIDDIANPCNVQVLYVGSNFEKIEGEQENWCRTIDYVRNYYKGLITYRTNKWDTASWAPDSVAAYESKLNNKLFSKLDFISIAAYFELTDNSTNTVENLVSAIESSQISVDGQVRNQKIKKEIERFYYTWNKPIFFGELGFPKVNGASTHPWDPGENTIATNNIEQANCFKAYRKEFENEPWFLGFSIFAIGRQGDDKHYYPSEESTSVIRTWYSNEQ